MARTGNTLREGLVVGLIGYAAVAVFYAAFDVLAGRGAVFTLNLLGKVMFRGVRDPAILQLPIAPDVAGMVMYNFVHLLVALSVGLFVAWLMAKAEERPKIMVPVLGVAVAGYIVTVVAVAFLTQWISLLLPLWTIVTVNSLAALGGGAFLWRAHPGLWVRAKMPV